MADKTKIGWTNATVNYLNGCTVLTPGCTHCYAMKLAGTRLRNHPSREGLTAHTKAGPVWNGIVRPWERELLKPLRWRKSRMIFWNAHGDLFHENVPDEWIDRQFAVMALTSQHTHQVLTKRSERMRAYMTDPETPARICRQLVDVLPGNARIITNTRASAHWMLEDSWSDGLPNVWLGVSVEDLDRQRRIVDLLTTPAAVRWISAEPLLEGLKLRDIPTMRFRGAEMLSALTGSLRGLFGDYCPTKLPALDWIVIGVESGQKRRSIEMGAIRSMVDDIKASNVALFVKQLEVEGKVTTDMSLFPKDLRIQEWPR